ncbi:hypothetical protein EXIGLDRAFT_700646 [Exidia glandulosa HHB12029]|uniref:Uncharacterized protein n=1 Tax=Exidia glandulosa HHB12029 TaxID=1314781 RepID=A0A165DD16_EXIGL|nr:hypothetical protein EXIGLDRAFT_700646 [Exidia glandulosa HHB12029]
MPSSTKTPSSKKSTKQPATSASARGKKNGSNLSTSPSSLPSSKRVRARDLADKENTAEASASSPGAKKKVSSREKAKELEARVERLTKLLEQETAERKKLERASHAPTAGKKNPKAKIPAPGTSKFCLRDAMGLTDKPKTYKACQRAVRRCVDMADLDHTLHMKKQDVCALSKVYKAARSIKPYLKRFEHNWATYEFIKMLLRNRRQHSARRDAHEGSSAHDGESSESDEGSSGEEDEGMDEDEDEWLSD